MPVEKINGAVSRAKKSLLDNMCNCEHGGLSFGKKIILTLFGIFLTYSIVLFGSLIRNNLQKYQFIGKADAMEHMITVEAEGKVTAVPNVATVSMGLILPGATVAEAQQKSTDTINLLISKLKKLGIDKVDIQTKNYNIYPRVKYTQKKGETPDGYEVNQNVVVKIRDLTKASQVLALAGDVGANSVQGVQFTIDDPDVYRTQARDLALQKVGAKVRRLSQTLGVRIVGVVSFNEYEPGPGNIGPSYDRGGIGGATAMAEPQIESGNNDIVMHVSVTYQIQ